MADLAAKYAAKLHVEEIRTKKFAIGKKEHNPLAEDLHHAVTSLSAELYTKDEAPLARRHRHRRCRSRLRSKRKRQEAKRKRVMLQEEDDDDEWNKENTFLEEEDDEQEEDPEEYEVKEDPEEEEAPGDATLEGVIVRVSCEGSQMSTKNRGTKSGINCMNIKVFHKRKRHSSL